MWQDRAYQRYARAAPGRAAAASRRFAHDSFAINGIELVVGWCASENIDVRFARVNDGGSYTAGAITVCSSLSVENQLYVLLHECGHHVLCQHVDVHKRFGKVLKTNAYKVDLLQEELDAWKEGLLLAGRLGVCVDENKFNKIKTDCVVRYMKWALSR